MKIDFSKVLLDLKGEPLMEGAPPNEKPITLSSILCTALLAQYPDEQSLSGKEKAKRFQIALKIVDGGEQDVSVDDVAEMKKLIGKGFGPLIVGRAYEMLDPQPKVVAEAS